MENVPDRSIYCPSVWVLKKQILGKKMSMRILCSSKTHTRLSTLSIQLQHVHFTVTIHMTMCFLSNWATRVPKQYMFDYKCNAATGSRVVNTRILKYKTAGRILCRLKTRGISSYMYDAFNIASLRSTLFNQTLQDIVVCLSYSLLHSLMNTVVESMRVYSEV